MSAALVDANVLLDVMTEDTDWIGWSAEALERAADHHRLVINPIIYAEVSIRCVSGLMRSTQAPRSAAQNHVRSQSNSI